MTGAGLDLQDGSDRAMHQRRVADGATIPGVVASHDSGSTYFLADAAQDDGIDVFAPIVGWVHLATGETVKSKPTTIRTRG